MLESHCISEKEIGPNTHIGANSLLHLDQKTDLKIHTHIHAHTRKHTIQISTHMQISMYTHMHRLDSNPEAQLSSF